ncbi:hypothetical protein RIF29_38836 [Crotalaria pallida]|uniref:NB-ARC domain-containing protein n=1 Tax=Crotalaria pallida TaxID=3830 RepID=A0AAN9HP46_CROPI
MVVMEIITSVAAKIAEFAVAPIGRQLGYMISYKTNFEELKIKVKQLEGTKDTVQHSVDEAIRNGQEIEKIVLGWLEKVDSTVAEANQLCDNEGHAKAECSCGHFPNLWTRHQLSRKATKIAEAIPGIMADGDFQKVSFQPPLLVGITSSNARGYEALDSRTSILNQIMQTLKNDHVCMVGLYGLGGVGKSSLVQQLAWKIVQDGSFGVVVSAIVTSSPDVKAIQVKIAESLGLKFNEETPEGRASKLRARICKEQSILIIMDDIWEKLDLIEVGVPFGEDHKGCKLFFTSRNLDVLTEKMGVEEQFCFILNTLSTEESWSLFERKIGDSAKDNNLRPTALKVAEACGGLPVLICPVANALKNKRKPAWDDALKQLTRLDKNGLTATVYSAINLSYEHLENDELKSLFLLLGSFGQTKIWTKYLLIYFWSLNLYEDADSLAQARNRLYNLATKLRSACLLLEEEGDSVKMHDLVHEVASKLASKDRSIFSVKMHSELKEWPEMNRLRQCYRMFLPDCRIHDLPKSLECPELEILVLVSRNNFLKAPDHFFAWTQELKVLYLGGIDVIPSLPSSLSHLPKLRALYLRECMLEDITLVAELKNLEFLGFEHSEIRKLPQVVGKLTRLRLLDLTNVSGLKAIPAKLISSLPHLEELYMANTFIQWEDEGSKSLSKNASLGELRHLLQLKALEIMIQDASVLPKDLLIFGQLDKYTIFVGNDWKWSWKETISKTLKLNQGRTKNIHLDQGIKLLLNNVEELCLTNLNGVTNVLSQLNEEGFPQLSFLDIQSSEDIQCIIHTKEWHQSCAAFPKLEYLVLHNLPNMSKICEGPLQVQSFSELKVIKVKGCDQLENVFLHSMVKGLSKLVEVEISQCKTMSQIIADDDTEIDKIEFPQLHSLRIDCTPNLASFYSKPMTADIELRRDDSAVPVPLFGDEISFPNLENLKISSIYLRRIWDDHLSDNSCIQNLKSLVIDDCSNLVSLFPSSVARGLVNLQHLSISRCDMLQELFPTKENAASLPSASISLLNDEVVFPSLETLAISHMDSLESIFNHQLVSNSFPKLIKLEISFCSKLMSVFSSYELKHLSNLETMLVTSCDSLEVVFEIEGVNYSCPVSQQGLQTKLKILRLEDLPMLKHIWSKDPRGSLGFQNLCTVNVSKCQSLNHVFPLYVAMELKKLEVLDISNCSIDHIVENDEMAEIPTKLVLRQLKSLKLWFLTELRNFCNGMHTLECLNLKELDVLDCDKLEIFALKSRNCQDESVDHQPLFSFEKIIQSVEEFSLSSKDSKLICNDPQCDDDFYKVKALRLQRFNSSDEDPTSSLQRFTNLEKLTLFSCDFKMEQIQENTQMEQILQNLQTLEVYCCGSLKTIAPSPVLFQNLNTLLVSLCDALVNIIFSRTVASLPRLRNLAIFHCEMLEEIVVSEDDDAREITFVKLELLELRRLPKLTSFCKGNLVFKFPLLQSLCVVECPMMETFTQGILSAPLLRSVYVTDEGDEWLWDGDLNTTVAKCYRQSHCEEV